MEIIDNGYKNEIIVLNEIHGKIKINGDYNKIILSKDIKDIDISLEGDKNIIDIKPDVKISKLLKVNLASDNSIIKIGESTSIYSLKILINENSNKVEIGKDCMISENVIILASDSHSIILKNTKQCINYHKKGVKIGNHVWLGMNSLILKDSQIGDNSIIAAGSVVTDKKGRENVILGGNPAKVIKKGVTWERNQPQKQEVSLEEKNGSIKYFIENIGEEEKLLKQISGWAYAENCISTESEIYFEIQQIESIKTYKAQLNKRIDIAKIYGKDYEKSGFNIIFPKELKLKNIKNVEMIIKNKNNIYKTNISIQGKEEV